MAFQFLHSYADLGEDFVEKVLPSAAVKPQLISFNSELADFLNLDLSNFGEESLAQTFSGATTVFDSQPVAQAYAGHQFGHFVPQLGDGRAVLLGEVLAKDSKRYDIQLKGSGPTKFSRGGDGFSSLGPVIREYIVSEAMHSLGVPTTRALAAVTSGAQVYRDEMLPGGIFTRVASSHIRVGTFEYFLYRNNEKNLKKLADYSIKRHYPELLGKPDIYFEFFHAVAENLLTLVTQWMALGFIHGVMNTDNTTVSGETIDYGPCAFMDEFSASKVFSSIDRNGRYAYANQGNIALWNLSRFGNCLVPLLEMEDDAILEKFEKEFDALSRFFAASWLKQMSKKFGIFNPGPKDIDLVNGFLQYLEDGQLDFTNSFRKLPSNLNSDEEIYQKILSRLEEQPESLEEAKTLMNQSNPFIVPRNHLVEKAIQLAYKNDFHFFHELNDALKTPYSEHSRLESLTVPPQPHEVVQQTFCGT